MKKVIVKVISFFIKGLHLEEQVETAKPLPIMLVAHQIQRNIEASKSEMALEASERMIQTHLLDAYPLAQALKYVIRLRWEVHFRRAEIGCNLLPA